MAKNISILGSTGSIGTQTLDVVRELGTFNIEAISTNTSIELFEKQIREFNPQIACVFDEKKALELKKNISGLKTEVLTGLEGLIAVATVKEADTVENSVVGSIGLVPTVEAIKSGKNIALANKETLVTCGELVMELCKEHNVSLLPVDSEHSAIFQCLRGNSQNKIKRILLTASGGPFRQRENLDGITVEDALKHPNWAMGKKITIDSATLMNKGLEVIEAKWLFGVELEEITVVVHPQSIIHSMVEYEDGAIIAQLGVPDMKLPIQYALTYPDRLTNSFERFDIFEHPSLTFERPRVNDFPCLKLAFEAIKCGGTMPACMNAANEIAVAAFLERKIGFLDIPKFIESAMQAHDSIQNYTLEDALSADRFAREYTTKLIKSR